LQRGAGRTGSVVTITNSTISGNQWTHALLSGSSALDVVPACGYAQNFYVFLCVLRPTGGFALLLC
jgi:hypothetical protein